jgi:RNA polymerase sigma-70 factor (ECF subfamily)
VHGAASLSSDLTFRRKRDSPASDALGLDLPASDSRLRLFEETFLPHMNAAYDLARWLTRSGPDAADMARDIVQEAYLRAFRFFDTWHGGDGKAWLLAIVRNTSHTSRERRGRGGEAVPFDETLHSRESSARSPEQDIVRGDDMHVLRQCIESLPREFREVLVLRELEEMSYRGIAEVTGLPMGTVMSRLSRARRLLADCAADKTGRAAR